MCHGHCAGHCFDCYMLSPRPCCAGCRSHVRESPVGCKQCEPAEKGDLSPGRSLVVCFSALGTGVLPGSSQGGAGMCDTSTHSTLWPLDPWFSSPHTPPRFWCLSGRGDHCSVPVSAPTLIWGPAADSAHLCTHWSVCENVTLLMELFILYLNNGSH